MMVTENKPLENINQQRMQGTLIQDGGSVGRNAAGAAGQLVFLDQYGPDLPKDLRMGSSLMVCSATEALIHTTQTDDEGNYAFRVGPGRYALGTLDMVDHDPGDSHKLDILKQREIRQDLHSEWPRHLHATKDMAVGLELVHQDTVCNYTMVIRSCAYCHFPVNASPKPRPHQAAAKEKPE